MCGGREEEGTRKRRGEVISLLDRGMEKFRSVRYLSLPPSLLAPRTRRDFHALIQEIKKCRIGVLRYHDFLIETRAEMDRRE